MSVRITRRALRRIHAVVTAPNPSGLTWPSETRWRCALEFSAFMEGGPVPQPRVKASSLPNGLGARVYDPGDADDWRHQVGAMAILAMGAENDRGATDTFPLDGPCRLRVALWLPRPAGHIRKNGAGLRPSAPRWPHKARGDWDNFGKAIADAMTEAAVWTDDRRVVRGEVEKCWAPPGGAVGAVVRVDVPEE